MTSPQQNAALDDIQTLFMMEDLDSRYRRVLAKQLAMNPQTWATLQSYGVTEATALRLDFSYQAPDSTSAESLRDVLRRQTDYDVAVDSVGEGTAQTWSVIGATQPSALSLAILDQWVDWMVTAGLHSNCEFDGWGAQA